jgi:hypothetical protein
MSQIQAPLVVTPVYAIRVAGTLNAAGGLVRPAGNTFYYRLANQVITPTKTALNTIFSSTVITPLKAATSTRYVPGTSNIRNISDAADPEISFTIAGAGAIATDSEPSADAVVVALLTAARGRQGRSYKHLAGVNEADTTGDVLTGGGKTAWEAVRDGVKATLVDSLGNTWVPFVRCNFGAEYHVPPIVVRGYDATGAYLQTVVGTMRKRKTKGIKD